MNSINDEKEIIAVARKALQLPEAAYLRVAPIMKGGSTRSYFRILYGEETLDSRLRGNDRLFSSPVALQRDLMDSRGKADTVIFMQYDREHEENNYYAPIDEFLFNIGVRTPRIIYYDPLKGFVIMEDLGDEDLWSFRDASWEVRRGYYYKALEMAHKLHSFPLKEFPSEQVSLMEGFGPTLYRWEHNYFLENFVQAVCRVELDPSTLQSLENELANLIERLEDQQKSLVHRDFQSQNVMIHDGEPALIDFQGLRFGSPFYDLGSLLYDPYCVFTDDERLELLHHYYSIMVRRQDWEEFQEMFRLAAAQRLMQALGAYGYLGLKLQKKEFLQYILNGIKNILDATVRSQCLPQLENICRRCRETLRGR